MIIYKRREKRIDNVLLGKKKNINKTQSIFKFSIELDHIFVRSIIAPDKFMGLQGDSK